MSKKLILLPILFTIFCSLFTVTGCYEPTKEKLKTLEERGWISTTEAEGKYLSELKKWANIPKDAKIENVSMYGGKVPKAIAYGKEIQGSIVESKIKIMNEKGKAVRDDLLSWTKPSKDKEGNISAYIASDSYAGEQNRIVLLNEKGDIEKEIKLIHREEKKGSMSTLKEHNVGYLSENGQYIGKFYVKYWTDVDLKISESELPNALYRFQYMDKDGNLLWEVSGDRNNAILDNAIQISKDGSRVLLGGVDYQKQIENTKEAEYLALYAKDGKLISKHYYFLVGEIKLTKDGENAVFEVDTYENGETGTKFIMINLGNGQLTELKNKNWNELNEII